MNFYITGYELPGNIFKEFWGFKEQMFKATNNPLWLLYPVIVILEAFRSFPDGERPLKEYVYCPDQLSLSPPFSNKYSALQCILQNKAFDKELPGENVLQQNGIPCTLFPAEHKGILLGPAENKGADEIMHTVKSNEIIYSFFPVKVKLWEIEMPEHQADSLRTRVIESHPIRKKK